MSLKHQATNHRVPKLTKDDRLDDGVESHHFALVGAVGHRTLHHRANADLVREVEMREVIGQAGNTATAATLRGRRRVSVVGAAADADVLAAAVQRGRPTGRRRSVGRRGVAVRTPAAAVIVMLIVVSVRHRRFRRTEVVLVRSPRRNGKSGSCRRRGHLAAPLKRSSKEALRRDKVGSFRKVSAL